MAWKPALIGLRRGIERLPTSRARETSLETKGERTKREQEEATFRRKLNIVLTSTFIRKQRYIAIQLSAKSTKSFPINNLFENPKTLFKTRSQLYAGDLP